MKKLSLLLSMVLPLFLFAQNVGIGTATPTAKLEVKQAVKSVLKISSDAYTDTTQLVISNRNNINQGTDFLLTSAQELGLFLSSTSDLLGNINDSLFSLLINGNVGVGCKFPAYRFQVHNPSLSTTAINISNSATGAGAGNGLLLAMSFTSASLVNLEAGNLNLGTNNLTRATIDASGNVGINNASPDEKLDVSGNIKVSGEINRPSTTTTNLIPIAWGNVDPSGGIYLSSSSGNFTVTHSITGFYEISITGESYQFQTYSAIVTPVNTSTARFATTGSGGGQLHVKIWDISGVAADTQFNFVVYKK